MNDWKRVAPTQEGIGIKRSMLRRPLMCDCGSMAGSGPETRKDMAAALWLLPQSMRGAGGGVMVVVAAAGSTSLLACARPLAGWQ